MSSIDLEKLLRENAQPHLTVISPTVAERIEETLYSLPDRKVIHRTNTIRRYAYFAAAVVMLGCSLAALALFSTPEMKSELNRVPVLGSLFPTAVGELGQRVTDNGISLTIRNVDYDGTVFTIDYSLQSEDAELSGAAMDFKLKVDDLLIDLHEHNKSPDVENLYVKTRKIDSRHYEGVIQTKLNRYRPPSFNLRLDVTSIGNKPGKWSFAVPVANKSEMITIEPSLYESNDLVSLKLDKLIFDSIRTEVKIHYLLTDKFKNMTIGYELVDDTGYIYGLTPIIGHYSSMSTEGDARTFAGRVSSKARYLEFRPYFYNNDDAAKYKAQDDIRQTMNQLPTEEQPLIIPQGNAGRLIITGIEYLDYRTVVHFRTQGFNSVDQSNFKILDEHGNLFSRIAGGQYERRRGEGTAEFKPFAPDEKLTFVTRPVVPLTYLLDLNMRIDLPE